MKRVLFQWLALSGVGILSLLGAARCGGSTSAPVTNHRAVAEACAPNPGDTCVKDDDCGATGVCSCKGATFSYGHMSTSNVCVQGNCRTDADCGSGGMCSPTVSFDCGSFYGVQGYYCHTPNDTCHNDSDCDPDDACAYSSELGYWACTHGHCIG